MRSGSSVASREKHYSSSSTDEQDSDESYSSDEEVTGQRPSNSKAKGETDYDEETPTTGTGTRKGTSASAGTSGEGSEDLEDDESTSSTKSGSSESTLKDGEEDSQDSTSTDPKSGETRGSNGSLTGAKDEESEFGNPVPTSSRLKTVHSKPTSTPSPAGDINPAATPALPLPSIAQSAQPVGCTGGINATSSYCSPSNLANHVDCASKLDSRVFFVIVLFCSFGLL